MTREDDVRKARIFGDGTSEDGGMPLHSSLAQALLEKLADGEASTVDELMSTALHQMTSQRKLLEHRYGGTRDEPVRRYMDDMLAWLRHLKIITAGPDGQLSLGPAFTYGQPMVICPNRQKSGRISIVVYGRTERAYREAEARERLSVGQLLRSLRAPGQEDEHLDELVWSIRTFGPDPYLAPVEDDRGLVLAGNRRKQAAELAGVDFPSIVRSFPDDKARLRFALLSNLGTKQFSREDRRRIARYLYDEENWSQEQIAGMLGVGQATVHRDLIQMNNLGAPSDLEEQHEQFDQQVRALRDDGMTQREVARRLDTTFGRVQDAWQRLEGEDRLRRQMLAPDPAPEQSESEPEQEQPEKPVVIRVEPQPEPPPPVSEAPPAMPRMPVPPAITPGYLASCFPWISYLPPAAVQEFQACVEDFRASAEIFAKHPEIK